MPKGAFASTGLLFFGTISSLFNKISKSARRMNNKMSIMSLHSCRRDLHDKLC